MLLVGRLGALAVAVSVQTVFQEIFNFRAMHSISGKTRSKMELYSKDLHGLFPVEGYTSR